MAIKNAIIFSGGSGGGTDISDADAAVTDVVASKTFYAGSEPIKTGTMVDRGTVSTDITTVAQEVTIAAGKHSGSGIVKISATEQAKIIGGNIATGVTILGVDGTAEAAPAAPTTGLFKWGLGDYWSGNGADALFNMDSDNDWEEVALGDLHGLAIKAGKLYSWGLNTSGRTGQGITTANTYTVIPKQIGSYEDWWKISAGYDHSLGIRKTWNTDHYEYTAWAWGEGGNYQTGLGAITDRSTPYKIGTDTDWEDISAGYKWSCAIKAGKLYTWGYNVNYATGQNTGAGSTTAPTSYDNSTGWTSCAAGYQHGLGIKSGQLWSWGESGNYATGQGNTTDLLIPTQVGSSTDWVYVNAGRFHSGAINSSGELYMFGSGSLGRLGNGSQNDLTTPTKIGADTDWQRVNTNGNSISSGQMDFTFAIKGGKLYATGSNIWGQCSQDLSTTYYTTFQQIGDGTNYTDTGAGAGFGMAIRHTP